MRSSIVLATLAALTLASGVGAATLNKCIDAKGQVTYSNLPCRDAREARTVEIDRVPSPDPVRPPPARTQAAKRAEPKPATSDDEPAPIRLETQRAAGKPARHASARQCDALTDKLGRVIDKMDQAHRKGYTQEQMEKWNLEVKELERKKQQSGCF